MLNIIKDVVSVIHTFATDNNIKAKKETWKVDISNDISKGHLTTNCVFILAKELKEKPMNIGRMILKDLETLKSIHSVEFINPGFINIYLKNEVLTKLSKKSNIKESTFAKKKSMYLEYVSANPTGVLHLGHLRIGLATKIYGRLYKFLGGNIYKEFLVNDGGVQVSTLINSIKEVISESKDTEEIKYYSDELLELTKEIKQKPAILEDILNDKKKKTETKNFVINFFLNHIKHDLIRMGIETNDLNFIHEEEFASTKQEKELLNNAKASELVYEKDGAIFLKTTKDGDTEDRVLVKSDKNRTYVFSDILYHIHKFNVRPDYTYLNVWGADQQNNEKKMRHFFSLSKDNRAKNLEILYSQMVHLKKGNAILRMSKRNKTLILVKDVENLLPLANLSHYIMSKNINTTLAIDINLLKKNDKTNTLYYLQYSYARLHQLLEKAKLQSFNETSKLNYVFNETEQEVILLCNQVDIVLEEIVRSKEIHKLYTYLYNICEAFNSYYQNHKVLDSNLKNEEIIAKINVLKLVKFVMNSLFSILDIETKKLMVQEN